MLIMLRKSERRLQKQRASQWKYGSSSWPFSSSASAEKPDPATAMQDIASRSELPYYMLMAGNDEGPRSLIATNWNPKLLLACTNQSMLFRNRLVEELGAQLLPAVDVQGLLFTRKNGEQASLLYENAVANGIRETVGLRVIYSKSLAYIALLSAPKLPEVDFAAIMFDLVRLADDLGRDGIGTNQLPTLTPRELECLKWIAAGKNSSEVGTILDISAHTVNGYMKNVFAKLGVVNRMQAVGIACQLNLI